MLSTIAYSILVGYVMNDKKKLKSPLLFVKILSQNICAQGYALGDLKMWLPPNN